MKAKTLLVILLRLTGVAMLGAVVFVFSPFAWMQKIHAAIGMGELEYTALLSYLTRTLSAMYAIVGAILLFVSWDIRRYLPLIRALGVIAIAGGAGVTILDALLGLPAFWTILEGPLTVGLGAAILVLARKTRA